MFVNWSGLSREDWDELVEALLYRMYDRDGNQVTVFNGIGGDGGRDVIVKFADGRLQIFQLKHFPGGFSGGFGKRRTQIDGSYKKAMEHDPDIWTLVVPENLKAGETTFLEKLIKHPTPSGTKPTITKMARTELNNELAKFADIKDAFERRTSWQEFRETWNVEAGVSPGNLREIDERVAHMQESIDAADLHWTIGVSTIKGQEMRVLQPKHPRAHELSPISVELHTDSSKLSPENLEKVRDILGFGLDGEVEFPPESVQRFVINGPAIVAEDVRNVGVAFWHPTAVPKDNGQITVRLRDEAGLTTSTQTAVVEHANESHQGTSIRLRLFNILWITLKMPHDHGKPVDAQISVSNVGASLGDIVDSSDFYLQIYESAHLDLLLEDGTQFLGFGSAGLTAGSTNPAIEDIRQDRDFAADLDTVQKAFRQRFPMPASATVSERVMIRAIRLLIEGKRTTLPDFNVVEMTVVGREPNEALRPLLDGEARAMWGQLNLMALSALGHEFTFETLTIGAPEVILMDPERVLAEYEAGALSEHKVKLRPKRGGFFSAVAPQYVADHEKPLELTPWNMPGVTEPGNGPELPSDPGGAVSTPPPDR